MADKGGMGLAPLSSREVMAWAAGMGIELAGWEFKAIRAASSAYVSEFNAELEDPPYGDPDDFADEDVIEEKLSRMFDRMAQPIGKA